MRKFHCSKCGYVYPKTPSVGAYSYTCPNCGQITSYTVRTDGSSCNCPICAQPIEIGLGNWLEDEGTVIETFDSASGWTTSGTGTYALNTTEYRAEASIKITNTVSGGNLLLYKTVDLDLSDLKTLSLWVYVHQTQSDDDMVRVLLASQSNLSKYVEKTWANLREGWNHLYTNELDWNSVVGDEDLSDHVVRIRVGAVSAAGSVLIVSFDELRYNEMGTPIMLFTCDDVRRTAYDPIYTSLIEIGVCGTWYLTYNRLDASALYVTTAMCEDVHENGWTIANHTLTHPDLLTISDEEIIAELTGMSQWMVEMGWSRGAYHMAYPYGHGSVGISPTVLSCGILSARLVSGGNFSPLSFWGPMMRANTSLGEEALSVSDAIARIDRALAYGEVCPLTLHGCKDPPDSEEYTTEDFATLVSYIESCGIKSLTIDQFYNGLDHPSRWLE